MSPDSPLDTRTRKAWRFISALGCLLGATGILLAAILSASVQHNTDQVDQQAQRGRQAICAIINYGEQTLEDIQKHPMPETSRQKDATERFRKLVYGMKATGIKCPSPPGQ